MNALFFSFFQDLDTVGLKYLHYYLLNNGHSSNICYLPHFERFNRDQLENIKELVLRIEPKLIGISLMSDEYHKACQLTTFLKSFVDGTPVIWGGIHPTISPDSCLKHADYVCVGEGEKTILDIADHIEHDRDIKHIRNLCYLEDGNIKQNALYPLIEDLDKLPSYDHIVKNSFVVTNKTIYPLDVKIFSKYARNCGKTYGIITTRGCPFSCTYCCNNVISRIYNSNKIRKRSIPHIMAELNKAVTNNPQIEYINYYDDCFLACSDAYLEEFTTAYKKEIKKPFIARTIPTFVTKNKVEALKEAGLAWINIGLQSGSDRVCKDIYKRTSLKADFLKAAKIIKDFNVAAFYDVILDNPFETEGDRLDAIETLIKTPKPYYMQFTSLTFYYGTELYELMLRDFPQHKDEHLKKDYLKPQKNPINTLTRLATFISERYMNKLLRLYKENPNGAKFRWFLSIINIYSLFLIQPLTYFKVLKLSQNGSFMKTIRVFPIYFKEGVKRYIKQFTL
jgi:anaerobic magnesium-protoporphyrin IX monomethyl ester cyclase